MLWINLKRIFKSGFVNFWRNGYVSLASIVVMIVTLSVIALIYFTSATLSSVLEVIKEKVDVNVYFVTNAEETDILETKRQLESLPEVSRVDYISRESAILNFRKEHEDNETILQGLDELGENPLGASLNIKAKEPSQYESIATYLQNEQGASGKSLIDNVTYFENQKAITTLSAMIESARKLGAVGTIVFVLVSILITFNTIRLAIYISREEISVMRLVGASNTYIRGPFIVGGMMYGAIASFITMLILYPVTWWMEPVTEKLFDGISVFGYYLSNFFSILGILLISGIAIGGVSSYLAVRKYLAK